MRSLLPTLFALLLAACPQGSLNDEAVGDDGMVPDPNNPAKAFCIDDGD